MPQKALFVNMALSPLTSHEVTPEIFG